QRVAVDPFIAAGPSANVRRRKKILSHPRDGEGERQRFARRDFELAQRSDHDLDRAFDERRAILTRPECVRLQELAQRNLQVVLRRAEVARNAFDDLTVRRRRYEFLPQLVDDEQGGLAALENEIENLVAVEVAALSEYRLFAIVVEPRPECERAARPIDTPAGEGARRFLDVAFAVMALPQCEELHHFAR